MPHSFSIRATGVAKRYEIGARQFESNSFREQLERLFTAPWERYRRLSGTALQRDVHWALQDVSFEVRPGEALGIIGRNGGGKSTLLKVLSRITEPTAGRILVNGRVASLLEVGTGFHGELTGRENIFLNGAILGMSRAEITRKFDAIVDFAEVERFLDTPVKRYSSGMYMRLAFAVAANLDPDVLLVDEVLAVGDVDFQKKCIDRMKGLTGRQTTVVFVSHNMSAIQSLCNRCLLLDKGQSVMIGDTPDVVKRYMEGHAPSQRFVRPAKQKPEPSIIEAELSVQRGSDGSPAKWLHIDLTVHAPKRQRIGVWLRIKDPLGTAVAIAEVGSNNPDRMVVLAQGETRLSYQVEIDQLVAGEYTLSITLILPGVKILDDVDDCLRFVIERPHRRGDVRSVEQSWGYGSIQLPVLPQRAHSEEVPDSAPVELRLCQGPNG